MLVLIWKLSLSTFIWVPICQGFSVFPWFLHYFVLANLATSSIRVKNERVQHTTEKNPFMPEAWWELSGPVILVKIALELRKYSQNIWSRVFDRFMMKISPLNILLRLLLFKDIAKLVKRFWYEWVKRGWCGCLHCDVLIWNTILNWFEVLIY